MPIKNGFVYVYVSTHIANLLEKVQSTGKPDKLTTTYVQKNWLMKDSRYSAALELFREMGFTDQNGVPTTLYSEYQNPLKAKEALGKGTRNAYPSLFKTYPKAYELLPDQLKGFVKEHTGADESVVKKICTTITTLCTLATFETITESPNPRETPNPTGSSINGTQRPVNVSPSLQLNIELHISADMTEEKIESIFKSMKKYLLSGNE
jgi:hypothetical protein